MTYRFEKPRRAVSRVFLHCSASDHKSHDNIATMRKWHTDPKPKGRGWSDVGYHFFIRKNGKLKVGRPLKRIPAAQARHNKGTIAICCHGLKKENFTAAQFETLRSLCNQINDAYGGKVTFHGHKEVAAKACPVFDYKAVLGLDAKGRLLRRVPETKKPIPAPAPKPNPIPPPAKVVVKKVEKQVPVVPEGLDKPKAKSKSVWASWGIRIVGALQGIAAFFADLDWKVQLALIAVSCIAIFLAFYMAKERNRYRDEAKRILAEIGDGA